MADAVRVLLVEPSADFRQRLATELHATPGIEIVGVAADAFAARSMIWDGKPDVLVLALELPVMNGVTFLKSVMQHRPIPTIATASDSPVGAQLLSEATSAGAKEACTRPAATGEEPAFLSTLVRAVKAAGGGSTARRPTSSPAASVPWQPVDSAAGIKAHGGDRTTFFARRRPNVEPHRIEERGRIHPPRAIILMGASTGGTEALKEVLRPLPPDLPGICIVQHIPALFSRNFAIRLNELCRLEVKEAEDGDALAPGRVLVAPGGFHVRVRWTGAGYRVVLSTDEKVHHQRPAVDVLFRSAVEAGAAPHALGVLLTGMGSDGARGMFELKQAGAETIAQSEETCVVFGMPREAIALGGAGRVLPLSEIASAVDQFASSRAQTGALPGRA